MITTNSTTEELKPVVFALDGKRYAIPMRDKNAAGEPMALIPLSDYSHIVVTLKKPKHRNPYYSIRHFWPMEKTSVLNGFQVTSEPIFWDSARSLWGVRRKVTRMMKTMKKEGVHPRFF